MEWGTIWSGFVGMVGALAVVASLLGAIEALFKPIRRALDKRDRRINQETRVARALDKLDEHFLEQTIRDERIRKIENRLEKQDRQHMNSREERQILWQGMRAILQALRPLAPEDESIRKALADMDDYANRQMRRWSWIKSIGNRNYPVENSGRWLPDYWSQF